MAFRSDRAGKEVTISRIRQIRESIDTKLDKLGAGGPETPNEMLTRRAGGEE